MLNKRLKLNIPKSKLLISSKSILPAIFLVYINGNSMHLVGQAKNFGVILTFLKMFHIIQSIMKS